MNFVNGLGELEFARISQVIRRLGTVRGIVYRIVGLA